MTFTELIWALTPLPDGVRWDDIEVEVETRRPGGGDAGGPDDEVIAASYIDGKLVLRRRPRK